MNPIVDGEGGKWNGDEKFYTVAGDENYRIRIPQAKIGRTTISNRLNKGITKECTETKEPSRHLFHIPTTLRNTATLPSDVGNIAAALNYQVHVSEGALEYCNLMYHTLIGSLKDKPANNLMSPDLIRKLEDLQKQVEQLSSKVGDIRLSRRDIDQISSQIGVVVSANVQAPTAEDIASRIKVPSARDITEEIGELSLNEFTKSDIVNRITKLIPVSGLAKDIADKIVIPPFKVPTAAEIASHIQIPSAADLASRMKIPSAQEIASWIRIPETKIDYSKIATEVADRIHVPGAPSIDISSLAQQIADLIPKFDPATIAANIHIPPPPAFPKAEQIASRIRLDISTAQEIANELAEMKPDIVQPVNIPSAPDYSEPIKEINRKYNDILDRLHGLEVG